MKCWCGVEISKGVVHYPMWDPEAGPAHKPTPPCSICGDGPTDPCVREQYIQYEEGMAGFDAPVRVGDLCPTCREEEGAEIE